MHSSSHKVTKEEFTSHPLLARLLTLPQVPKEIYIKGTLPSVTLDEHGFATPRILTIVGSRKHSTYGKDVVNFLVSSLLGEDVIIVSGLALGIDSLAHKASLENNLLTISIPGSGLGKDVIYPRGNLALASKILETGGVLLSEYSDTTKAESWSFPARNRLMAAISDVVLLVEAEVASGTLITARYALELGKDIGIIPGSIFSPTSKGVHALLHDGAIPICTKEDLFELLHLKPKEVTLDDTPTDLTMHEKILYEILAEPCNKDLLLVESALTASDFMVALTTLEMKGCIKEAFGEVRRVV